MKRNDPANYPFQAGSLTAVPPDAGRSAVTKSSEGKSACERRTRNQSERRDKSTGRRKTNDCRHRKSDLAVITDRARYFGRRSLVLWEKSAIIGEESGCKPPMTRRCKRQRHVWRVSLCNWGGPAKFRTKARVMTNNLVDPRYQPGATTKTSVWCSLENKGQRKSLDIMRNAESPGDALQGVGDAHISGDDKDNITLSERRGISLRVFLMESRGLA